MKTLLLLRHAKSSWDDPARADHDRPLNRRGHKAARRMGRLMAEEQLPIDIVLCSTAVRTQETWRHLAETWTKQGRAIPPVSMRDELYLASPAEMASAVAEAPPTADSVLVIGHNPGLEEWLSQLTDSEQKMPTAALAVMNIDVAEWSEMKSDTLGTLRHFWRPRDLADD